MIHRAALALATLLAGGAALAEPPGRALFQGHQPFAAGRDATANRLPAAYAACASCHGPAAAGRREGGVVAPPVTWAALARPAGRAGAYADDAALRGAIADGVGRDGRALDPAMPRYRLAAAEMAALLDYLTIAGTPRDLPPGVAEDRIALGTVLPLSGAAAPTGRAVLAGIQAGLAGAVVHGRRVELQAEDGAAAGPAMAVRRLLDRRVFLVVGGLWSDDAEAEQALAAARVPHIGSLLSRRDGEAGPWVADLLAPRRAQQAVLAAALDACPQGARVGLPVAPPESGRTTIAWQDGPAALAAAMTAPTGCLGTGLAGAGRITLPPGWRWEVVLPFPAMLVEADGPWQRLGLAAARLALETLAQAGAALHEHAPLDALPTAFEALPGAPLRFAPRRRHGWDPEVMDLTPAARPEAAGMRPSAHRHEGG